MDKAVIYSNLNSLRDILQSVLYNYPFQDIITNEIINSSIINLGEIDNSSFNDDETSKRMVQMQIENFFKPKNISLVVDKYWNERLNYSFSSINPTKDNLIRFRSAVDITNPKVANIKSAMLNAVQNAEFSTKQESKNFWKYLVSMYLRIIWFLVFPGIILIPILSIPINYLILANHPQIAIGLSIFLCVNVLLIVAYLKYDDALSEIDYEKRKLQSEYEKRQKELQSEYERQQQEFKRQKDIFSLECDLKSKDLNDKENRIKTLLNSTAPFKDASILTSDVILAVFSQSASHLRHKRNPALKAAQIVDNLKKETKRILLKSKEIEYKYEYILNAFPEILEYVQSDNELLSIGEHYSYSDLETLRDYRRDYLSNEEYIHLSEDEKSQLALDRYIASPKNKWEIGRDYEMSCAMQMRQRGYTVELHGIKYRREDLGRDLIATQRFGGLLGNEVMIIQCKNWSKDRIIHENVMFQLFGTSVEFEICNDNVNQEIIPVLMIPPHCNISPMALKVAKRLKILIERMPFKEFPRIKCNINHGERIYHLPFDQLYDRAEIKLPGEFYAWNVAEAVHNGFRRAKRHIIS